MLRSQDWRVDHKRVEQMWRNERMKVPSVQSKQGRLWLNDGSCIRLRTKYPDHMWSYGFMLERTHNGRTFRILSIIDGYSRECLVIHVARSIQNGDVHESRLRLFCQLGVLVHLRSESGPEFTAQGMCELLSNLGVWMLFIEPGSP